MALASLLSMAIFYDTREDCSRLLREISTRTATWTSTHNARWVREMETYLGVQQADL